MHGNKPLFWSHSNSYSNNYVILTPLLPLPLPDGSSTAWIFPTVHIFLLLNHPLPVASGCLCIFIPRCPMDQTYTASKIQEIQPDGIWQVKNHHGTSQLLSPRKCMTLVGQKCTTLSAHTFPIMVNGAQGQSSMVCCVRPLQQTLDKLSQNSMINCIGQGLVEITLQKRRCLSCPGQHLTPDSLMTAASFSVWPEQSLQALLSLYWCQTSPW